MTQVLRYASYVLGAIILVVGLTMAIYGNMKLIRMAKRNASAANLPSRSSSVNELSQSRSDSNSPVEVSATRPRRSAVISINSVDSDVGLVSSSRGSPQSNNTPEGKTVDIYHHIKQVIDNMKSINDLSVMPTQKDLDSLGAILVDIDETRKIMQLRVDNNVLTVGSTKHNVNPAIYENIKERKRIQNILKTLSERMNLK